MKGLLIWLAMVSVATADWVITLDIPQAPADLRYNYPEFVPRPPETTLLGAIGTITVSDDMDELYRHDVQMIHDDRLLPLSDEIQPGPSTLGGLMFNVVGEDVFVSEDSDPFGISWQIGFSEKNLMWMNGNRVRLEITRSGFPQYEWHSYERDLPLSEHGYYIGTRSIPEPSCVPMLLLGLAMWRQRR